MVGISLMPQTITNNGNQYVGDAETYNKDLQNAQINSYGFKVIIIGLSVFGAGVISCICLCSINHIKLKISPFIQQV
jgi:hypothetical protein